MLLWNELFVQLSICCKWFDSDVMTWKVDFCSWFSFIMNWQTIKMKRKAKELILPKHFTQALFICMVLLLDTVPLASSNVESWLPYSHCVVSYLHLRKSVCVEIWHFNYFWIKLKEILSLSLKNGEDDKYLNLTTDFYFSSTCHFNWTVPRLITIMWREHPTKFFFIKWDCNRRCSNCSNCRGLDNDGIKTYIKLHQQKSIRACCLLLIT